MLQELVITNGQLGQPQVHRPRCAPTIRWISRASPPTKRCRTPEIQLGDPDNSIRDRPYSDHQSQPTPTRHPNELAVHSRRNQLPLNHLINRVLESRPNVKISDIQIRSGHPVYIHTEKGLGHSSLSLEIRIRQHHHGSGHQSCTIGARRRLIALPKFQWERFRIC